VKRLLIYLFIIFGGSTTFNVSTNELSQKKGLYICSLEFSDKFVLHIIRSTKSHSLKCKDRIYKSEDLNTFKTLIESSFLRHPQSQPGPERWMYNKTSYKQILKSRIAKKEPSQTQKAINTKNNEVLFCVDKRYYPPRRKDYNREQIRSLLLPNISTSGSCRNNIGSTTTESGINIRERNNFEFYIYAKFNIMFLKFEKTKSRDELFRIVYETIGNETNTYNLDRNILDKVAKQIKNVDLTVYNQSQKIDKEEQLKIFNKDFDALKQEWNKFENGYNNNKKLAQKTYSSISANNTKLKSLSKKLDTAISIVFDVNKFNDLKKEFVDLETLNKSTNLDVSTLDINLINSKITSIDNKIGSVNSFIDENIVKLINEVELLKDQSLKEKIKDILFTIGVVVVCLVLAGVLFFSLRKMDLSNLKSQSVHVSKSLNTFNSNTLNIIGQMLEKLMIISKRNTSIVVAVSVVIVVFALQSFTAINLNPFAKDEYANIDPSTLSKDEKNAYTCVKIYNFKKGSEQFRKCIFDINQQEIEKRKVEVNKKLAEEKLSRTKVEEADLEKSKKYDNVNFNNLSADEKIAYTCVKTYGFKVGSSTFQKCINKITEGELELKRIEIEKKVAEAQLLTAKANKEAALAKAEAARAQGEIQKAQVEAARAAAEASNQQAAAAQARIKAERFRNSMSLIESGLRGLQPRQNNTTTYIPQNNMGNCIIQGFGTFAKMVCR
jgi:uncharacterized membrane protein